MYINVILALFPAAFLWLISISPEEEKQLYRLFITPLAIWYLPFPIYLFFEIKHLVQRDGIAEDGSLSSILVFGGQSLLGLVLQVYVLVLFLKLELLGTPNTDLLILLSFLASFGGCLGLTDLQLLFIVLPHKVFQHSLIVLKNWRLVTVCLATTLLLSFLTSLFI